MTEDATKPDIKAPLTMAQTDETWKRVVKHARRLNEMMKTPDTPLVLLQEERILAFNAMADFLSIRRDDELRAIAIKKLTEQTKRPRAGWADR